MTWPASIVVWAGGTGGRLRFSPGRGLEVADRLRGPARLGARPGREAVLTDDAEQGAASGTAIDLDAFDRAFASHRADVARVCRRMLGAGEEARDAPHDIFVRARGALHTYDRERPFRPWLLAVAGNYCIDRLRRQASEQRVFSDLDPGDGAGSASVAEKPLSPLARLVAREERDALNRAISELPLQLRLPVVLRYFADLDYAAIAAALGVSRNQVGTLLLRAKRRLREQVAGSAAGRGAR